MMQAVCDTGVEQDLPLQRTVQPGRAQGRFRRHRHAFVTVAVGEDALRKPGPVASMTSM